MTLLRKYSFITVIIYCSVSNKFVLLENSSLFP